MRHCLIKLAMTQEMVQVGSWSILIPEKLNLLVCMMAVFAKLHTDQQILASLYSLEFPTSARAPADHLQQKHLSLLA